MEKSGASVVRVGGKWNLQGERVEGTEESGIKVVSEWKRKWGPAGQCGEGVERVATAKMESSSEGQARWGSRREWSLRGERV